MKGRPLTVLALIAAVLSACGGADDTGSSSGSSSKAKLSLVAYSTPPVVYEEVIAQFTRSRAGRGVSFSESYGGSGEQSRAVVAGLPADIVALSLEPDVTRLVDAGLVDPGWSSGPTRAWSPTRSSSWPFARATPRASAPGTTC